jgi:tripartite-type tricarboxylate transporter receptor subunit TctC
MARVAPRALIVGALIAGACGVVIADDYPSRIIKLVVAAPPGGGIDIVGRLIEPAMSQNLGQKIIVDNRPGANGIVGATFVAHAPPDGYTIFISLAGPVTNSLNVPISYDVKTAFQPISRVMTSPFFLVVPESSKIKTVADLIAAGKDPKETIHYGHPGLGTVTHLATELFAKMAGARFVGVPYRGSAAQVTDTLSGQVQFSLLAAPDALSRRNEGLRILAASTAERSVLAPDVPTIAESGVPGYDVALWHGLFVPAQTPRPTVERIRAALATAQQDEAIRARFTALGMVPVLDTPEQFATIVKNQLDKDAALVKELDLKPQ